MTIRDSTGAKVYAYRKTTVTKAPRTNPEHALQVTVARFLMMTLPGDVEFTASLAGAHLGPSQRSRQKAAGLRPGFPDLMFIIRRRTHFIELKAPVTVQSRHPERYGTLDDPDLSDDQRRVLGRMHPDAWKICRSVEEVRDALAEWGVELRPHRL